VVCCHSCCYGFGDISLIIAENTPLFEYLGAPFIPILTLLQIPEASLAAQTMVIGFADMFLPAVMQVVF
jgi:nucleoside recognition membrane protein YjiH